MKDVTVSKLPVCDIHATRWASTAIGRYDGPTKLGPHGNMCQQCFELYGYPKSSITIRFVTEPATHHGPWCDELESLKEERCPTCRA